MTEKKNIPLQHIYSDEPQWYILYVKSRTEKKVKARLEKLKIEHYLPLLKTIRQWSDRKKQVQLPLFNGYIFLFITPQSFTTVRMIEGAVDFIKQEKKYATIKTCQIDAIKKFLKTGLPIETVPNNIKPGESVKITFGPMKGLEGELLEIQNEKHFIVRIEVINQVLKISLPAEYLSKIE